MMITSIRLETISSTLADLFQSAPEPRQKSAVKTACLAAIEQTGLHSADIDHALELICTQSPELMDTLRRITILSENLDAEYLDLYEKNSHDFNTIERFRQARAASAVAFGLTPKRENLHESIYEALIAVSNQSEIIQQLEATLKDALAQMPRGGLS